MRNNAMTAATVPKYLSVKIVYLAPGCEMHDIDPHCRNSHHKHYWKPNSLNWYPEDEGTS